MIGTVTEAFIEAIRASDLVCSENISVVIANDNGEGTVNTALPAVAISVKGYNRSTGEFIGGVPYTEYLVQVIVITDFDNQAASEDMRHQYNNMDLSYRVMLYLNQLRLTDFFSELRKTADFSYLYEGIETEQTRGMVRELGEKDVFVHRLIYRCTFMDKQTICNRPGAVLPEDGIIQHCNTGNVKITDKFYHPNIGRTWQKE